MRARVGIVAVCLAGALMLCAQSVSISSAGDRCSNKDCAVSTITGNTGTFGVLDAGTLHIDVLVVDTAVDNFYVNSLIAGKIDAGTLNVSGDLTAASVKAPSVDAGVVFTNWVSTLDSTGVFLCGAPGSYGNPCPFGGNGSYQMVDRNTVVIFANDGTITLFGRKKDAGVGEYRVTLGPPLGPYTTNGIHMDSGFEVMSPGRIIFGAGTTFDVRSATHFINGASFDGVSTFDVTDAGAAYAGFADFTTAEASTLASDSINAGTFDGGTGYFTGRLSVRDYFSFGIGDGGTLNLSGSLRAVGDVVAGLDVSAQQYYVGGLTAGQIAIGYPDTNDLHITSNTAGSLVDVNGVTMSNTVLDAGAVFAETGKFNKLDAGTLLVTGSARIDVALSVGGYFGLSGDAGLNNLVATGTGSFGGYLGVVGDAGFNAIVATGPVTATSFATVAHVETFGTWFFECDNGSCDAEGLPIAGPFSPSSDGYFTNIGCNWQAAGVGSGNVTMSIFRSDAGVVCSCTLVNVDGTAAPCSTAAYTPLRCPCNAAYTANDVYSGAVNTATNCTNNPDDFHCNVTLSQ